MESSDYELHKELINTKFESYKCPQDTQMVHFKEHVGKFIGKIEEFNSLNGHNNSIYNMKNGSLVNLTRSLNEILDSLNKSYVNFYQSNKISNKPAKWSDLHCSYSKKVSALKFAVVYGGITGSLIQIFGQISGAHINPAITLSHLATGHVTAFRGLLYVLAQGLGSCLGTFIAQALTNGQSGKINFSSLKDFFNLSKNSNLSPMQGFGIEFLATFTMIMLIFSCLDPLKRPKLISLPSHKDKVTWNFVHDNSVQIYKDRDGFKELPISGVSNFAIMMTFYTSTATIFLSRNGMPMAMMNPIIHFGPAVLSNCWKSHWIYWVGPMLGALMAAFTYEYTCTVSSDTVNLDFKRSFRSKREGGKLSKTQKTADNIHTSLTHKMVLRPEVGGAPCNNLFNGMTEPLANTTMTTNLSTPDQDFTEN